MPGGTDHAFVIPAYGDSPHLESCLQSILAQTRPGSEVVIATSTPSAYVAQVAQRFAVPLAINPRRANIGSDWNFALGAVRAPLVTIAHQDDSYRPDYLARMREALDRTPDASIAFSDFVETTDAGLRPLHVNLRIKRYLTRRAFGAAGAIRDEPSKRRLLAWGNPLCCPSVVLNRGLLPDFTFTESLHSNLDWEAWLRLAERAGAFVYVREPLVIRRIHLHSETSAAIADRRRRDEDRAMFARLWPGPVAALIAAVYQASYLGNRT